MKRPLSLLIVFTIAVCGVFAQEGKTMKTKAAGTPKEAAIVDHLPAAELQARLDKLAPVVIDFDHNLLGKKEMEALKLIVRASQYIDRIFLGQVDARNPRLEAALTAGGKKPDYPLLLQLFKVNFGPYDRQDAHKPFLNLQRTKPAGAGFYPEDMSKEEFAAWIKNHPKEESAFTSSFTRIERRNGGLVAVPYSTAYADLLRPAAELLEKAAALTENPSLKKFLLSRAAAFLSNDYFQSDMDWVDLKDHAIEVVIGPYEVYEDNLFGYKASFESFVTIVDPVESKKLEKTAAYLDEMERALPIPDEHKNFNRGKSSPIMVVQEVFTAGDTKAGVQTTAFNLPNDERVREAKGSKKVMLKNIAQAKFEKCWIPIVQEVLAKEDLANISFEAYFNHVLMHEISHGLGPGRIRKNGVDTTVDKELKEHNPIIEEAKADVLGVLNLQFLVDKGVFAKELESKIYSSFLGGIFRSVRFGIGEAHGGGNVIILNYLTAKGGFTFDAGLVRYGVNREKIQPALKELAHELLMLEALGDYEGAAAFIAKYRFMSPELQKALQKVQHVPIDIRPVYTIEKQL